MKKTIAKKQPSQFSFTEENLIKAKKEISKYPSSKEKSAVMALLWFAQKQSGGWIPNVAMSYIADMLKISAIDVYEVASFYSMYNLTPVGKYLVQVCRTTPCWLCNSEDVLFACKEFLGIEIGETTKDDKFTLIEVECLGACVNAPLVQINEKYYENLTRDKIIEVLSSLR
ncbi:MAG: NADH-quinone oxidoreductase subunit NuoE [Rickettsiaceae bacterium H1]|nr:NADH-quinone oxidoreductase subunit NuoE [Rickettsiaceae bacterium H1]